VRAQGRAMVGVFWERRVALCCKVFDGCIETPGAPALLILSTRPPKTYRNQPTNQPTRYVASGPMVRSSYKAGEVFVEAMIHADRR